MGSLVGNPVGNFEEYYADWERCLVVCSEVTNFAVDRVTGYLNESDEELVMGLLVNLDEDAPEGLLVNFIVYLD